MIVESPKTALYLSKYIRFRLILRITSNKYAEYIFDMKPRCSGFFISIILALVLNDVKKCNNNIVFFPGRGGTKSSGN